MQFSETDLLNEKLKTDLSEYFEMAFMMAFSLHPTSDETNT